jgi:hypothetical protein
VYVTFIAIHLCGLQLTMAFKTVIPSVGRGLNTEKRTLPPAVILLPPEFSRILEAIALYAGAAYLPQVLQD